MRLPWVIATRLVAFAVTVALAWPLLKRAPQLTGWLIIYATATLTTVLALAMERRRVPSRHFMQRG